MSLRIPSAADMSERRMSNIDDFIESENEEDLIDNTSWEQIYKLEKPQQVSQILGESAIVVKDIIEEILDNGANILYNQYIEEKMDNHSILRTFHLLGLGMQNNYLDHDYLHKDVLLDGITEDEEPPLLKTEHWKRNAMQVEVKQIVVQPITDNQSEVSRLSIKSGTKSFLGASKMRFKSTLNVQKEQEEESQKNVYKYDLVDKTQKQDFDIQEDQYRKAKERDLQMKYEQDLQRLVREKELKEQQQRLKNLPNDLKKSAYTYDFDGKVIPLSGMKIEKLGPLVTNVGHTYSKENNTRPSTLNLLKLEEKAEKVQPDQQNNQKRSSNFVQQMDQLSNRNKDSNLIANEQQIKQLMSLPKVSVSDSIQMNPGVTFIQDQTVKTGADYKSAYDLNNQDNLANPNISIKMTKNEYLDITRGGNLSRSEDQGFTRRSQQNYKRNDQNKIDEEDDFTVDYKGQDILKELNQKTLPNRPRKRVMESSGTIKPSLKDKHLFKQFNEDIINNTQMDDFDLDSITMQTQPNISNIKQKYNNHNSSAFDSSIMDSFNLNLITHGSKGSSGGDKKQDLVLPRIAQKKTNHRHIQSTLGKLSKLPRDRIGKVAYQVHSKSLSNLPPHKLKQYEKIKLQQLEQQNNSQFDTSQINNTNINTNQAQSPINTVQ